MPLSPQSVPKIFISHSAREGVPKDVRGAVAGRLTRIGFTVLQDDTAIGGGEFWRAHIEEWIRECDSALVVLSEAATQKDWVRYEMTRLLDRARYHSDIFTLLPLRFSDMTDDLLKTRLNPLPITAIQHLKIPVASTAPEGTVVPGLDGLLTEVETLLHPSLERRKPRHELEEELINLFLDAQNDALLRDVGQLVGVPHSLPGTRKDR